MGTPTSNEKAPIVAFTLDFETGGLNCQTCACTQIAIHAVRIDTFEILGRYVKYITPYSRQSDKGAGVRKVLKSKYDKGEEPRMEYQQRALDYAAITMDMLETQGEELKDVAQGAVDFMAEFSGKGRGTKPFLIGQNIGFDEGFFCQMMEYAGLMKQVEKILRGHKDFYGHFHPLCLDTILLGQLALSPKPEVTSYKLEIMCEHLGIELNDAHDADADVAATTNVVAVCTQRMRNAAGDSGQLATASQEKSRLHFKI